jgi:hypothetical protein
MAIFDTVLHDEQLEISNTNSLAFALALELAGTAEAVQ